MNVQFIEFISDLSMAFHPLEESVTDRLFHRLISGFCKKRKRCLEVMKDFACPLTFECFLLSLSSNDQDAEED